jgi:excisionase family DNA binding protein
MSSQGMNISQVAKTLGVSTRTIRRYIKAGKLKAELITGPFGEEYRIRELPSEMAPRKSNGNNPGQNPRQTFGQAMDIVRELQGKNLALAAQLGAATERIRNLEGQVKLLAMARKPWWRRIFSGKA